MATVHLTTDSEPGLRGEHQGFAAIRRPCELPKGGASNAESSSTLAADPDRARARFAGRDGLGPVGSTSSGGGRACVRPSRVRALAGDLDPDVGVHRLPNLQVKLDLATLLLVVRCVGATDDQPLAVIGNGEARTVEMLPQFGDRRRVEQSKSHQAADLTSADRRGSSTAQTRAGETAGPRKDPPSRSIPPSGAGTVSWVRGRPGWPSAPCR